MISIVKSYLDFEETNNMGIYGRYTGTMDIQEEENAEEKTTEEVASEEETVEVTTDEETTEEETTEEYGIMLLADDTTTDEVKPVTNLRWSEDIPGEAVFYNPNDENVSFVLHYYKDGQHVSTWNTSIHGAREVSLPVYSNIYESGEYTYIVETFGYGVEKVLRRSNK